MKKYLFLLVAVVSLALSSGQAYAQRYLPKMMGVELRGGFVNGSKSPLNYYTGIAMSGYTKKANRWVVGAEYLLKNYDYRSTSIPRAQFTAEGGYYLKFLSDPTKTFFLSSTNRPLRPDRLSSPDLAAPRDAIRYLPPLLS